MSSVGKRWYLVVIAAVVAALAFGVASIQPAAAKKLKKIPSSVFGIHAFDGSQPGVPTGSIRLNCYPTWRDLEPSPGKYDWSKLEAAVAQAEGWGYQDILLVFCGTPRWAVGSQKPPRPDKIKLAGDATAQLPPAKMSDWKSFVTAVAKEFRGRIDSYQIWNEITSPDFYQGSGQKMAKMTKVAYKAIGKADRKANVIGASVQTHDPIIKDYQRVAEPYFAKLKKMKWPVTHVSGHFYPAGKAGPDKRLKQIAMFKKTMKKNRLPKAKEIWDTESNFVVGQSTDPNSAVGDSKAAAYVVRNFLDTWRTGLTRSYWYQWSTNWAPFPGVQLRPGDPATAALNTFGGWVQGAKYKGCKEKGKLVVCQFKKGGKFQVAFTTSGKKKYKFGGKKEVCPVYGKSCKTTKKSVQVKTMPVKIG